MLQTLYYHVNSIFKMDNIHTSNTLGKGKVMSCATAKFAIVYLYARASSTLAGRCGRSSSEHFQSLKTWLVANVDYGVLFRLGVPVDL